MKANSKNTQKHSITISWFAENESEIICNLGNLGKSYLLYVFFEITSSVICNAFQQICLQGHLHLIKLTAILLSRELFSSLCKMEVFWNVILVLVYENFEWSWAFSYTIFVTSTWNFVNAILLNLAYCWKGSFVKIDYCSMICIISVSLEYVECVLRCVVTYICVFAFDLLYLFFFELSFKKFFQLRFFLRKIYVVKMLNFCIGFKRSLLSEVPMNPSFSSFHKQIYPNNYYNVM